MTKTPKVVFVVVNWNQRQLTLDCLASLREQKYPNFEIVLVDNGSKDDSVAAVYTVFPEVTIKENGANLGIAAANNVGIRYALEHQADYVFLLNNDTVVDPGMLAQLVNCAESASDIGSTSPTMLYFDQPDVVWCAGASTNPLNGTTKRLMEGLSMQEVTRMSCRDVEFTASCAVCIKSELFQEIGMMDERYFIYYDETDWFARAATKGWRSVYVPSAKMWHKVSATMGTTSPITDYYMNRNVFLFLAKNKQGFAKIRSLWITAFRSLMIILAYTVKPQGGKRLSNRNARFLALRDALIGRWGKMGPDVEAICYRKGD